MQTTSVEAGKFMNVVISPFSVWTVLSLIREGSGGKTNSQLQKALHLHENNKAIRAAFRNLNHVVHVSASNGLFCNILYINDKLLAHWEWSMPKCYTYFTVDLTLHWHVVYDKVNWHIVFCQVTFSVNDNFVDVPFVEVLYVWIIFHTWLAISLIMVGWCRNYKSTGNWTWLCWYSATVLYGRSLD